MFFCEFCDIFKNKFFIEHVRWLLLKYKGGLGLCRPIDGRPEKELTLEHTKVDAASSSVIKKTSYKPGRVEHTVDCTPISNEACDDVHVLFFHQILHCKFSFFHAKC